MVLGKRVKLTNKSGSKKSGKKFKKKDRRVR